MLFFKSNIILLNIKNSYNKKNRIILRTTKNVYCFYKQLITQYYVEKEKQYLFSFNKNAFKYLLKNYFLLLCYIKNFSFFLYRNKKLNANNVYIKKRKSRLNNKRIIKKYYKKLDKSMDEKFIFSNLLKRNKYYYFQFFLSFLLKNKKMNYKNQNSTKVIKKKLNKSFFYIKKDLFNYTTCIRNKFFFYDDVFKLFFNNNFYFFKTRNDFIKYKQNIFFRRKKIFLKKKKNFHLRKYLYFFNFYYKKNILNFLKWKTKKKIRLFKENKFISFISLHEKKLNHLKTNYQNSVVYFKKLTNNYSFFDANEYVIRNLFKNIYIYFFFKWFKKKIKHHFFSNLFQIFFSIKKERINLKKKLTLFLNLGLIGTVTYKNTLRNIFLTLSKNEGKHLYHISSGHLKFFGRKKVYYKTIYNLTRRFLYKIESFLYENNIFFIKIVIRGYLNDISNFLRPFFKRSYYFQQYRHFFKNYLFLLKKYILYIKKKIMLNNKYTLLDFNKYLNVIHRCYYLSAYISLKFKKSQFLNFKLLYIQIKSNKSFLN